MSLYNLTNATTPDGILIGLSTSVPVLPIMFLVFVFCVTFIGGIIRQNTKSGYADVPQWALISSMGCLLLGLVMTISSGIIGLPILSIIVALNILSGAWFFLSRGRQE